MRAAVNVVTLIPSPMKRMTLRALLLLGLSASNRASSASPAFKYASLVASGGVPMGRAGGKTVVADGAAGSGVAAYCAITGAVIRQDATAKDTGRAEDKNGDTLRILLSKNISGADIAEEDDWRKTVGV